jgi:hypothetical protein
MSRNFLSNEQLFILKEEGGGFCCMELVQVNKRVLGVLAKLNNYIHKLLLGGLASKSTRNVIN